MTSGMLAMRLNVSLIPDDGIAASVLPSCIARDPF
jgi:hypothetical protein